MDTQTKNRLKAAGFVETNVAEVFGLSEAENELVETRVALSHLIKQLRVGQRVSQKTIAMRIGSDQGRVARAEHNDPTVSIDLMFKLAYALGAKREQVALALVG